MTDGETGTEAETKVAVAGVRGRMGRLILDVIKTRNTVELVGAVDRNGVGDEIREHGVEIMSPDEAEEAFDEADVAIEFTSPEGTQRFVEAALSTRTPLVTGTTGLTDETESKVEDAADEIPVLQSSNFATGVNAFWEIVEEAASLLPGYDYEVTETHHRHKVDAPSGTALTTVERIENGIGDREHVHGREGDSPRGDEIGVHARRAGEIVGEHEVLISGEGESVIIKHRAGERRAFAAGAVDAGVFLAGQEPGLYGMDDVLDL
ncbi:MAG: 4-hydroxy-tetrahydrodipicolinate reductase [Halobacteria archaeon]|nr:4-hydroxy-tetrahydrodipicolinate reductase [Halobacteria archaeon]